MWMALDAGLSRFSLWGDGSVPHRFLVLIFIIVVYFVGGSQLRTWIQTSRLSLELASSQFQPKYFARFSYELKADRLSLRCSRFERLKRRQKYKAPMPFTV